jgi:RNA polymerase sporulation-specific sigma factor
MFDTNDELIKQAQAQNEEAMETLVKNNTGLIWNIAKRFSGRGYDLEEIYQIGAIGLIKAIKNFDFTIANKLSTYAFPFILGEIKRFLRDDGIIKVSRTIKQLKVQIYDLQNKVAAETGKQLTVEELAKRLQVSVEEITESLEADYSVESIDEVAYASQENNKQSKIDLIADTKSELINIEDKMTLKVLLQGLKERDKQIILLRYFKSKTQTEVAKMIGISQVQVSRIETKIINNLRKQMTA